MYCNLREGLFAVFLQYRQLTYTVIVAKQENILL